MPHQCYLIEKETNRAYSPSVTRARSPFCSFCSYIDKCQSCNRASICKDCAEEASDVDNEVMARMPAKRAAPCVTCREVAARWPIHVRSARVGFAWRTGSTVL